MDDIAWLNQILNESGGDRSFVYEIYLLELLIDFSYGSSRLPATLIFLNLMRAQRLT